MASEMCDCGEPLHYTDPKAERRVRRMIKDLGPVISISMGGTRYFVPRHYVALHGVMGAELPELAARYDWRTEPSL